MSSASIRTLKAEKIEEIRFLRLPMTRKSSMVLKNMLSDGTSLGFLKKMSPVCLLIDSQGSPALERPDISASLIHRAPKTSEKKKKK